jgi:hypothetical protein
MPVVPIDERWLPLPEAAAELGVSRELLRSKVRRGTIPARKSNKGWLVKVDAQALERLTTRPAARSTMRSANQTAAQETGEAYAELIQELRGRAERAEAQAERERQRADRVESERDGARLEAHQRSQDAAESKGRADVLSGRVEALERALADARRPWWRRWRRR